MDSTTFYGANHTTVCKAALDTLGFENWDLRWTSQFFYGAKHNTVCRAAIDTLGFEKWDLR